MKDGKNDDNDTTRYKRAHDALTTRSHCVRIV